MKKEKFIFSQVQLQELENIDYIVLGSEGCIYQVLSEENRAIILKAIEMEKKIRLVTPFVPDKYVDALYERIREFSKHTKLKVVFNDYGMLYKCKTLINEDKIKPVIGRILTRSIVDCTWAQDLLRNEPKELAENVLGFSFNHGSKIELLKEYKINEIEINTPTVLLDSMKYPDLKLTMYEKGSIVSIGRVCFAARYKNIEIPKCLTEKICDNELKVQMISKWTKNTAVYEKVEDASKYQLDDLYVKGNIVYRRIDKKKLSQFESHLHACIY